MRIFLGPVLSDLKKGSTPIADGYRTILPLLQNFANTRTLFVSTVSYAAPDDRFSLLHDDLQEVAKNTLSIGGTITKDHLLLGDQDRPWTPEEQKTFTAYMGQVINI